MKKLTITCLLILFTAAADEARACICTLEPYPTPEQIRVNRIKDFDQATAVFSGEVVMLDLYTVKLKVKKVWKGPLTEEITMLTGAKDNADGTYSISSCDFRYVKQESYLIYAYGPLNGLKADVCSRSMSTKHAASEREEKALDEIAPPQTNTQRNSPVAVGDTAPDFTLEDQNGNKVTLSDSRSKNPVVLVFYRAYW
jgi:hypothetical protein